MIPCEDCRQVSIHVHVVMWCVCASPATGHYSALHDQSMEVAETMRKWVKGVKAKPWGSQKYKDVPTSWWNALKFWSEQESGTHSQIKSSYYHKHLPPYLTVGTCEPPSLDISSLWCPTHHRYIARLTHVVVTPTAHTKLFSYHNDSPTTRLKQSDFDRAVSYFGCGKYSTVGVNVF
jgi:hypothetical protein